MDLKKIFLKDACPTKMGGQAVMEGIMMKGEKKTALAVRLPSGDIQIKTFKTKQGGKWTKIPIIRGVAAFIESLVTGTRTLMDSAEILEENSDDEYEETRFERWLEDKFGSKGAWNLIDICVCDNRAYFHRRYIHNPAYRYRQHNEILYGQCFFAEPGGRSFSYTAVHSVCMGYFVHGRNKESFSVSRS